MHGRELGVLMWNVSSRQQGSVPVGHQQLTQSRFGTPVMQRATLMQSLGAAAGDSCRPSGQVRDREQTKHCREAVVASLPRSIQKSLDLDCQQQAQAQG
jgi:hypothetical protein